MAFQRSVPADAVAALGATGSELMQIHSRIGAPGRNRTRDLRFTKPLLYQLSYKGNFESLLAPAARKPTWRRPSIT